jgi:hypothetical protein
MTESTVRDIGNQNLQDLQQLDDFIAENIQEVDAALGGTTHHRPNQSCCITCAVYRTTSYCHGISILCGSLVYTCGGLDGMV